MLAHHGFKLWTLADLVHAGRTNLARPAIGTGRIRITGTGRSPRSKID